MQRFKWIPKKKTKFIFYKLSLHFEMLHSPKVFYRTENLCFASQDLEQNLCKRFKNFQVSSCFFCLPALSSEDWNWFLSFPNRTLACPLVWSFFYTFTGQWPLQANLHNSSCWHRLGLQLCDKRKSIVPTYKLSSWVYKPLCVVNCALRFCSSCTDVYTLLTCSLQICV